MTLLNALSRSRHTALLLPKLLLSTLLLSLLLLGSCSNGTVFTQDIKGGDQPSDETVGAGAVLVGLLAYSAPVNLSDGSANAVQLAGRLAAEQLSGGPVTLVVRHSQGDAASVQKAATDFITAGVDVVIGPQNGASAVELAKFLSLQEIPVLSLAQATNPQIGLYAAGVNYREEAIATVAEMLSRGYKTIYIIEAAASVSQVYSRQLNEQAKRAGLTVKTVVFTSNSALPQKIAAAISADVSPTTAIAFAIGPKLANEFLAILTPPATTTINVVGNSGWSIPRSGLSRLRGAWFPTFSEQKLASFIQKFQKSFKAVPTLESIIVYDLVVLSGALPQLAGDAAFTPEVLKNEQGFSGQSGTFVFTPLGRASREFIITTVN